MPAVLSVKDVIKTFQMRHHLQCKDDQIQLIYCLTNSPPNHLVVLLSHCNNNQCRVGWLRSQSVISSPSPGVNIVLASCHMLYTRELFPTDHCVVYDCPEVHLQHVAKNQLLANAT